MMKQEIIEKYNKPVPRYTSYPPANFFNSDYTSEDYLQAVDASNEEQPETISFYIHIPFCRRLCFYCGCNSYAMGKPEMVEAYLQALEKEMDLIIPRLKKNRKIAQIHYGGGTPTCIPAARIKQLNDHLLSAFDTIEKPEIAIECHPGYMDENYWKELIDAGFSRFSIGIQDFNEDVLRIANRKPPMIPIEKIFSILKAADKSINMDFIYGLPHQTAESFLQSMKKAVELRPDRLVTFSYAHIPFINKLQLKLEKAGLPTNREKEEMYLQAKQYLISQGYHTIGMDHFVLDTDELYSALSEKKLHRNFQGYCTRRTTGQVYAFGVSGISQLNAAYAQNTKNIEEYISETNAGRLTIRKGYALNKEQQLTREVITSLMCNCTLNWKELADHLHITVDELKAATAYEPQIMKQFSADGLIHLEDDYLEMLPDATPFVRTVAASLDKLLLHSNKQFSNPV